MKIAICKHCGLEYSISEYRELKAYAYDAVHDIDHEPPCVNCAGEDYRITESA